MYIYITRQGSQNRSKMKILVRITFVYGLCLVCLNQGGNMKEKRKTIRSIPKNPLPTKSNNLPKSPQTISITNG